MYYKRRTQLIIPNKLIRIEKESTEPSIIFTKPHPITPVKTKKTKRKNKLISLPSTSSGRKTFTSFNN